VQRAWRWRVRRIPATAVFFWLHKATRFR
jgi:hypothetical protein